VLEGSPATLEHDAVVDVGYATVDDGEKVTEIEGGVSAKTLLANERKRTTASSSMNCFIIFISSP
jgi:hypothetical protein